ncbi:MAG: carboxypeptidase-like regulatory domain-containing protein [Chlorobi bacterium]|nr:carboxypeptidase-like regulatory domain-containing protein [Chlorobiota bacterium]
MTKHIISIIFFVFLQLALYGQGYTITGTITDRENKRPLSFANIRVDSSNIGTSANIDGTYVLKLKKGNYKLIASYIGYKSDTINLSVNMDIPINFKLLRTSIKLGEVTVLPSENPALEIIKRAIKTKNIRNKKLNSYEFNAYTKGIIKTTSDISTSDNSVGMGLAIKDTADLKITGLFENESKGYFKKPDNYKEEITAQKQSANFPSSINLLTGGRMIQNFYSDDIEFFGRPILSPIADNALDFYYYRILDTIAYNNTPVFKIHFEPDDKSDPGFYGTLFITDSTFNLIKVDVNLNDAANPGGIFKRVNVIQQYLAYDENIYMPIDYRLFVKGNVLGMAKFGFEVNSVLYDYKINNKIDDNFFDMVVLKVMPEADKKDSTFWKLNQKIPNTLEEVEAYKRIDSVEALPRTFWNRFSWFSTKVWISDDFYTNGTLNLYHYNKVEGSALNLDLYYNDSYNKRFSTSLEADYGFSDKKFKWDFNGEYLLGEYRTTKVSLNVYDRLGILFKESDEYGNLISTLTSLFGHYDFRNYFYSKGVDFKLSGAVFPILDLGVGFTNRTDKNAKVNTEYSFFAKDKMFSPNTVIYEGKIVAVSGTFKLDFRKFIENGYFRRRTSLGKSYFTLDGEVVISNKSKMTSNLDFQIYKLNFWAHINSFRSTSFEIYAKGIHSNGPIPYQLMTALPGNITALGKDFTFRTVGIASYIGDRVYTITTQYRFNDEIFKMLKIPFLKDASLKLDAYFNVAWLSTSDESKKLNYKSYDNIFPEFIEPLYEIGFGIGHVLLPIKLEFTWRLNHKEGNSFVIAINSVAL